MPHQRLVYHGLVSRHSTLAIDLEIMRQTGFSGLEISAAKMRDVLAAGFTDAELAERLRDVFVPGIGFLTDIERHGADGVGLVRDAEEILTLATIAGAKGVQAINGPIPIEAARAAAEGRPYAPYRGVLGLPRAEQVAITARNLAHLADLAAERDLLLYFEALAWLPLSRLVDQVEVIRRADRENLRLVVDFWHCYASDDTPEDVARLDKDLIFGVHVCDSRPFGGGIPDEPVLRDVPTGQGVLRLRDWTDAVKATGYQGWWSCELFCRRQQQDDSFTVARDLHTLMADLILN